MQSRFCCAGKPRVLAEYLTACMSGPRLWTSQARFEGLGHVLLCRGCGLGPARKGGEHARNALFTAVMCNCVAVDCFHPLSSRCYGYRSFEKCALDDMHEFLFVHLLVLWASAPASVKRLPAKLQPSLPIGRAFFGHNRWKYCQTTDVGRPGPFTRFGCCSCRGLTGLTPSGLVGGAPEAGGADPLRLPSPLKVDLGRMP
jgi:hypothetical protein